VSADITVSVAGSERSVPAGTTAADLFAGDASVVVARVNGELVDLARVLADKDAVEPVTVDSEDGLNVLRHSSAHVLAQAVQQLHPDARDRRSRAAVSATTRLVPSSPTSRTSSS